MTDLPEPPTEEVEKSDPAPTPSAASPAPARPPRKGGGSSVTRVLLVLTVLGLLIFVGSVGGLIYLINQEDVGEVADGSYLQIYLQPSLRDAPGQGGLFAEPDDFPPVVTEITAALRRARTDDRIDGLVLRFDGATVGWANARELRDAILEFQADGKPCVAYSEAYTNQDYYLASACEHVLLAPSGVHLVAGLSLSITYYADAFEKIGLDPEFEHVGDFKSGPEPYQRTGPSEEAVVAYESFMNALSDELVRGIAESRKLPEERVRELINHPSMDPKVALANGLVDGLAFPDAVQKTLRSAGDDDYIAKLDAAPLWDAATEGPDAEDDELFTSIKEYLKTVRSDWRDSESYVAVIHADGTIVSGDPEGGLFSDAALADRPFRRWMAEARDNDKVKAVVLRVNSPGGSGLASDMMWREIVRTQEAGKPVVVSMANYAASGGYYISAPADWIVAQPTTLTGSIGVYGGKFNVSGTYEKLGMNVHRFKSAENADLLAADSPFSEEGRTIFKGYLENFYSVFVGKVAEGRGRSFDDIHEVAKGRVWTGAQAKERGLVDELGGIDVALAKAAELGGISDADWGLLRLPEQKPFFELLMEDLQNAEAPQINVKLDLPVGADVMEELFLLEAVLADGGVAAHLPGSPEVK